MSEQPMYRAYSIIEREKDVPFWLNLGVAFPHKDGKGFNVILQALPLTGKLVLRLYEEEPEESTKEQTPKSKKRAEQALEQA